MSTLAELVRARTDLREDDVEWLHRLVAEWQLVADLSFADLVLWARTREDSWLAVAHMRPTTGLTAYPLDVVGSTLPDELRYRVDRAARDGRIARDGEPEWRARVPVRQEAFPGSSPDPEHAPRVGDGYLRLDRTGHVVYASPNALSAYRRLGVSADLLGAHLGRTIARLSSDGLDEPRGSAALAAVLRFQEPRESEVEAQGATVLLRALPLVTAGVARGAVVLVRDVSELRRRDRQILGKDATIREIHHRVKNNLQTVAALLRLQARRLDEPRARAALEESVRRVSTIAVVHETLSLALDESVLFDAIADRVLAMCAEVAVAESDVRVVRVGEFGELTAEVATPLAMVLTELVQNAVEHAQATTVEVRVQRTASRLTVVVADDGRGLPAGFDLAASTRLGLQIVRTLVEGELRGTIDLVHGADGGTEAAVSVPLTPAP
ncbi:MAG: PAS domain-containing sensor histidine kinase [Actinobacteria bacterium]|nr:PAS domain-containing sensor histidine kinase [Actinomycetota bacterium]